MNVILCDDQPAILEKLCSLVEHYFSSLGVPLHMKTYPCLAALAEETEEFDMAFLDIELPDGNGLQAARVLRNRNKNVILFIVTSHQHYLDDAMALNVFRYISKPIDEQRITRNLSDAWRHYCTRTQEICIVNHGQSVRVFTNDILYLHIISHGTELITAKGNFECTRKLRQWSDILSKELFAQPHYSFIVNLKHVIFLKRNEVILLSPNGELIPLAISQRMYSSFRKSFYAMMEGNIC